MPNNNYKSWNANSVYGKHNKSDNYAQNRNSENRAQVEMKTPYSFVPIPDKVYFPEWACLISQDVPFFDGISGAISFNLVSQTPVFVRDNQDPSSFCKSSDGRFFIPATSLKGEIESVLRIMSFGKVGNVANGTFGNRNLNDRNYRDAMSNVHCGWMFFSSQGILIEDCNIPYRVSLAEIDKRFKTSYENFVRDSLNFKDDFNRTAKKKYEMFGNRSLQVSFSPIKRKSKIDSRLFVSLNNGTPGGTLVFTGQPGVRENKYNAKKGKSQWTGKFYEFVFPDYSPKKISLKVSDKTFQDFEMIHSASPDYINFRKSQLYSGKKIPVFFIVDNNKVQSIGLSYLYKYPFKKSINDAIPEKNRDENNRDLTECIFGYTSVDTSLKGRVHFGHAFSDGCPNLLEAKTFRLSQPRASFSPFYVKDGRNWDTAACIAGWKRYPIRDANHLLPSPNGTAQMETRAAMLPTGTIFQETIRFHNLKPCELGALISAITFHANNDKCLHNIGFGKPLGYGAMKVENLELKDRDGNSMEPNIFMGEFERIMVRFQSDWLTSPQLTELMLMARGIPENKLSLFEYLGDPKDFYNLKKANTSLASFSKRIGSTFMVKSLLPK